MHPSRSGSALNVQCNAKFLFFHWFSLGVLMRAFATPSSEAHFPSPTSLPRGFLTLAAPDIECAKDPGIRFFLREKIELFQRSLHGGPEAA